MRVLLLLSESWNDILHPNNNMTNWFQSCPDLEIWTISGNSSMPYNDICKHYFMVDESQMLKSLFIKCETCSIIEGDIKKYGSSNKSKKSYITTLKKSYSSELFRLARDIVWRYGKYDYKLLQDYITRCNPDIVFSQRMGSVKMCRLERLVKQYTSAPVVVYTGDDDFSLKQYNFNLIYWLRRFWLRRSIKKNAPIYKLLYSQSERQMKEYKDNLGVTTKFLVKSGDFKEERIHKVVKSPIVITYAGKLYCNRWKTLIMLVDVIKRINQELSSQKVILNIYTADCISSKQSSVLNDGYNSIVHPPVPGNQLKDIYDNSDILVHVEGLDRKNRLLTKDSFSTKVIDCLSSGCAMLVIGWEEHSALKYLRQKDAAMTAANANELDSIVRSFVSDSNIILNYSQKAYECGIKFHQREVIQKAILEDFNNIKLLVMR